MSQQVKIDAGVKRELALFSAVSGKTQGELVAESWAEYKERHRDDFRNGLQWAQEILGDAGLTAVHASGMSVDDISEIDSALNG